VSGGLIVSTDDLSVADVAADLPTGILRGLVGDPTVRISSVTHDSRRVRPGSMYCCIPGANVDGHAFAADAVKAGAPALVVDHELDLAVAQLVVHDVRAASGPIAASVFGHPSRDDLTVVGVTGTNGKTTVTHLLAPILNVAGLPCGVIGTLSGTHTTPEAPDLQRELRRFVDDGKSSVAMEVSSHALALRRVDGTRFAAAVFTNLGRDHLDLHESQERYFAAKARLFTEEFTELGVVNLDDVHGRLLADASTIRLVGFSESDAVDVDVRATAHHYVWRGRPVAVPLGGRFNVLNSIAAATTAEALGVPHDAIVEGLAVVRPVPGRFESIDAGQPFDVIVDYAHTPDGLRVALTSAREAARGGRLIVVFGCGGDRDVAKRPLMGATAAELADVAVVTSDNPRSEDPDEIIWAVVAGIPADYRQRAVIEPDRRSAIATAFGAARPGDMVVIAGKGHEATQTIGSTVLPFDDGAVARDLLENLT
jgi:UDP-N-acetylmuramoyl-L-alanyl-D-glutamate--2,6-diaminopimelate ligase